MNIYNIPANYDFLRSLVKFTLDKFTDDPFDITKVQILLPSRRACNELKKIFLQEVKDKAILLPKIKAIGDIDYDYFFVEEANLENLLKFNELAKPTSRLKYKILLIKEILKWLKKTEGYFGSISVKQAGNLALELEKFLNEVKKNNLSLDNLDKVLEGDFSEHWQKILNFLQSFGKKWNEFLKENNIISIYDSRIKMIELNTEFLKLSKPKNPIIVAGCNASVKATANFIHTILNYDNCYLILKGLDIDKKNLDILDEFHPQLSFKKLIFNKIKDPKIINIIYENCKNISDNINIITNKVMLPAQKTYEWQEKIDNINIENLSIIECKDNYEELEIIPILLKLRAKENKNTAIITNNESFANELELRLKSLNLDVNNAFGNKLSRTKTSEFLFMILDIILNNFEAIKLLSLLKNPIVSFGYEKEKLLKLTMLFEDEILRKYRNTNGFSSFLRNINRLEDLEKRKTLEDFINNLYNYFKDLVVNIEQKAKLKTIINTHIKTAELIVENKDLLWKNDKGSEEIYDFFEDLKLDADLFGECNLEEYFHLLDFFIAENSYSDNYTISPSISLISPSEARLISYDTVIIPKLNEGEFPCNISADPWMNRKMRENFGLPIKEEAISEFAYDFVQFISQKEVILTRGGKELGIPVEKSRFLLKLETFLECQNIKIKENLLYKDVLNEYKKVKNYIKIEKPKPKSKKLLKKLSATNVEKLIKNPYDIYAKKILNLYEKNEIGKKNKFEFGNLIHRILELFYNKYNELDKKNIDIFFQSCIEKALDEFFEDEVNKIVYSAKIKNIKTAILNNLEENNDILNIFVEINGEIKLDNLDFILTAKADRIDIKNNKNARIIDYKTGGTPSEKMVMENEKLQLIIESIILQNNGFSEIKNTKVEAIEYWKIDGKTENIEIKSIPSKKNDKTIEEIIDKGKEYIIRLILHFSDIENPYVATAEDLSNITIKNPYEHLSRVKEWIYN